MTSVSSSNPYTVLGLSQHATSIEIKKAYFTLVRDFPPERDPEGFRRIRDAYEALKTPTARADTDRQLVQAPPPYSAPKKVPQPDLGFHPEDWLVAARRESDLERIDFSRDFRPIPDLSDDAI